MLVVLFQIADQRFAIDARSVAEVLPLVQWRPAAGFPPEVQGTFFYRGTYAPLIDLSQWLAQQPTPLRMNSRIVVVRIDLPGWPTQVGCAVGRASVAELALPPQHEAPQLLQGAGALLRDAHGPVQLLDLQGLLASKALAPLTAGAAGAP
jgi:chemotaxis-related protein WspB